MKVKSPIKTLIVSYLPVFLLILMAYCIMVESGKNLKNIWGQIINVTSLYAE